MGYKYSGGTPYKKDGGGSSSYLLGIKKQFLYLLGCSGSKGSQPELSRYRLGY